EHQPFRTGYVNDVIGPVAGEGAGDGPFGQDRPNEMPRMHASGEASQVFGKQQVAVVSERAEFLGQLVRHLGRAQPGVIRIVADEKDSHDRALSLLLAFNVRLWWSER